MAGPNKAPVYIPGSGSYGIVDNNMMNGSDDGEDQINPSGSSDEEKYSTPEEVPSEKSLEGSFKGG